MPRSSVMPNKKIPVFRVTRPYLNSLVKPRFFSGFLEKYNFMHACIKLYFFQKKNVYLPYQLFSDPLPETHLLFIWPCLDLCFVDQCLYFQQVLDMLNSLGVDNVSQQKVGNKNKIVRVSIL